jgi:CRISPR-associated protein Csm1
MVNQFEVDRIGLQVYQQAIAALLEKDLPTGCQLAPKAQAIRDAEKVLKLENAEIGILESVFNRIKLDQFESQTQKYYLPLQAIASNPSIPYPTYHKLSQEDLKNYQRQVKKEIKLSSDQWNNRNFLSFVIEKYGACVSYGDACVALVDATRLTAAIATLLAQDSNLKTLSLIAGDLSGIQKFIYTISSDGALKSLRARSFYLELVIEEIVQQVLHRFNLRRSNVIYAGGGNLFIMAGNIANGGLDTLQNEINKWLKDNFQAKIFLALDAAVCDLVDVGTPNFRECWNSAIAKINKQKTKKFSNSINDLLKLRVGHTPCKVCHRDDKVDLEPLNELEADSSPACETCRQMFKLGDALPDTTAILRSPRKKISHSKYVVQIFDWNYHFFTQAEALIAVDKKTDTIHCVNNWEISNYANGITIPMLLGNYYQKGESGGFITAEELAQKADGIDRIGYLRMDVDHLGQIFARGLSPAEYFLTRVAGLSRQMSFFFKTYLNSLASNRAENMPIETETLTQRTDEQFPRLNLLFIYAGGDDLFVSGAWNEVVEFAFDVYQSFRIYSGNNPSITISGGISIESAKFPLYQSAESAKDNGRDSLGLFGQAFKWEEWFGKDADQLVAKIRISDMEYWRSELSSPPMAGIFPFVAKLKNNQGNYSRSFVRNLLKTAQLQEQKIKEIGDLKQAFHYDNEEKDIRYYLHLPQIAYTLARLQGEILNDVDFRQSLKSPYNAPYFRAIATWIELLYRRGTIE